jgi:hypothetical protein
MTNDEGMPNDEALTSALRDSCFVINSSFVLRHFSHA